MGPPESVRSDTQDPSDVTPSTRAAIQISAIDAPSNGGLRALCLIARLHHIAVDPDTLAHQLGWSSSHRIDLDDLLIAARHIGLKAKRSRSRIDRLNLAALPALAVLRPDEGSDPRIVVLAQCDGQRVLFQDPAAAADAPSGQGARPTIEPLDVFATRWTGELILITSRASLAGELAKFDFSWFIPSLVKYRRLFGEVIAISLFLQLFALVSPLFFQVVMDKVLVHRGLTTLDVLVIGLVVVSTTRQPMLVSHAATSLQTRAWTAGSRTTPPFPTSSRPASNCGLISASSRAPGMANDSGRSSTLASPMKLASQTTRSIGSGICSIVRMRALVCSWTTTRTSCRSFHAS